MIEALIGNEFWQHILRFLFGSSCFLLAVWGLESFKIIQGIETRAFLWKSALFGSVLLLLPISMPQAPVIYVQPSSSLASEQLQTTPRASAEQSYQASIELDNAQNPLQVPEFQTPEIAAQFVTPRSYSSVSPAENAFVNESQWQLVEGFLAIAMQAISDLSLTAWLLIVWSIVSCVFIFRLVWGYKHGMQRLGTRHEYAADNPIALVFKQLSDEAALAATPRLTWSRHTGSPVTLVGNEICLPAWANDSLPESELKSLLAHELAHVRHRDLQLQLGTQLLSCLFFFQPLFAIARNRLVDLAEFLADQSALDQCKNSNAITTALVNCADRIQSRRNLQWGFAMVGNHSRLKQRIQRLKNAEKLSKQSLGKLSRICLLLTVSVLVLVSPSIEVGTEAAAISYSDSDTAAPASPEYLESLLPSNPSNVFTSTGEIGSQTIQSEERVQALDFIDDELLSLRESLNQLDQDIRSQQQALPQAGESISARALSPARAPSPFAEINTPILQIEQAAIDPIPAAVDINLTAEPPSPFDPSTSMRIFSQGGGVSGFFDIFRRGSVSGSTYDVNGDRHEWVWNEGRAEWRNDFVANDSEDEIVAIADDGYFEYRSDNVRPQRRILIEADGDELSTRYWVDGDQSAFDEDAREWFNTILLTLFRSTGVNAESRVFRMLENTGPDAVIRELAFISSDYISRNYNFILLDNATLSERQLVDLLETNKSIGSDLEMRLTLSKLVSTQVLEAESQSALIDVINAIGSDLEMRVAILSFVEQIELTESFTNLLLGSTASIGSDLEARLALTAIVNNGLMTDRNWSTFQDATRSVGSDLELRSLLTTIAGNRDLSSAGTMNSIQATDSIGSDIEQRQALLSIAEYGVMDDASWTAIFEAARSIGSDIEMRVFLSRAIELAPESELVSSLALHALDTVGSDFEMRAALQSIVENGSLAEESWLLAVNQAEEMIGNRSERNAALRTIADHMPADVSLRDAL